MLVLRQTKTSDRLGTVQVINAETLFRRGRNQNTLEPEHAEHILSVYQERAGTDQLCRLVPLEEIAANDHSLNIPLYVSSGPSEDTPTLEEALTTLELAHADVRVSREYLDAALSKWGL